MRGKTSRRADALGAYHWWVKHICVNARNAHNLSDSLHNRQGVWGETSKKYQNIMLSGTDKGTKYIAQGRDILSKRE